MKRDEYRMRMLHMARLPDVATPKTTLALTKREIASLKEEGKTRNQIKGCILKLYYLAMCADSESKLDGKPIYHHYYTLLHQFIAKGGRQ